MQWPNQNPKPIPNIKGKDEQTYLNKHQNYGRKAELAALSQTDCNSVTITERHTEELKYKKKHLKLNHTEHTHRHNNM